MVRGFFPFFKFNFPFTSSPPSAYFSSFPHLLLHNSFTLFCHFYVPFFYISNALLFPLISSGLKRLRGLIFFTVVTLIMLNKTRQRHISNINVYAHSPDTLISTVTNRSQMSTNMHFNLLKPTGYVIHQHFNI